jgi:hypothetical protein
MLINSDGQQFHRYQQNEQPPLNSSSNQWKRNRPRHVALTMHIITWDSRKNIAGGNKFDNGISTLSLL